MPQKVLKRDFDGKKVLVTGGAGFLGSNLAIELASLGAGVTCLDAFRTGCGASELNLDPVKDKVRLVRGDIGDRETVEPLLDGVDFVFNLAGRASHVDSMRDPATDLYDNATAHLVLLDGMRRICPESKILYTGTRGQYGVTGGMPVDEWTPQVPVDVNGVSKLAGEGFHLVYNRAYGLPVVSLRLCNVFGPRALVKHHRQGILNWFIRQLVEGVELKLYGSGRQVRDTLYVDDVTRALLMAMASSNTTGEVYNLGGEPVSLRDFVEAAVRVHGEGSFRTVDFPDETGKIEIGDYVANTAKFRTHTRWQALATLDGGIRASLDFYRRHAAEYF